MYPLCLKTYRGAAAELASGPIKTKISASSVSMLQAAFKKKEMPEILTPTLVTPGCGAPAAAAGFAQRGHSSEKPPGKLL